MYGWNDPIDPEGAPRRQEAPTEEPSWLTERPAPRSSYLFGDEPDRPADEWYRDQPTERWRPEPAGHLPHGDRHPGDLDDGDRYPGDPTQQWQPGESWRDQRTEQWQPGESWRDQPTGQWQPGESWRDQPTGRWPAEPVGAYLDEAATRVQPPIPVEPVDLAAHRSDRDGSAPADQAPAPAGRHRTPSRFSRPMLIGGAAAAATLVVSLGVGAVALTGNDHPTDPSSAVDDTVAAAPVLPGTETPADTLAPTSPSASPTTAKPAPSATPSRKPTPAPSRTTAPSRRTERTTAPSTAGTTSSGSGSSSGVSAQARQVVNLVNAERAEAGCGALSIDDKLMTAAQRHSQDQADHQNMSHTGSDGSDAGDRLDRVGYDWRTYGENVAWNQKTPAEVMEAWMDSPGHRANILNCAFTEIGVGIASSNGPYWTQVFAAPR